MMRLTRSPSTLLVLVAGLTACSQGCGPGGRFCQFVDETTEAPGTGFSFVKNWPFGYPTEQNPHTGGSVTVAGQSLPEPDVYGSGTAVVLDTVLTDGTHADFQFRAGGGLTVANLVGETLLIDTWDGFSKCFEQFGDIDQPEPLHFLESSLRNGAGKLLLLGGRIVLNSGGRAEFYADAAPELTFGWEDTDCAPHAKGSQMHAVSLTFKPTNAVDGTSTLKAMAGERVSFTLGGAPYTLVVYNAGIPARFPEFCGTSGFIVYNNEFLVKNK